MPFTLTRTVLGILVPGLIAITPWLLALVQHTKATLGFDSNSTLGHALIFSAAIVAGTFFEAQGTKLEVKWDNSKEEVHQVSENWYTYLSQVLDKEPVGYRYMSRLATTLYFELAMIWAAPAFLLGATILASLRFPDAWVILGIVGLAAAVGVGFYFHSQANCTHNVICSTRKELVSRLPNKD
jgi:hypothetical protein